MTRPQNGRLTQENRDAEEEFTDEVDEESFSSVVESFGVYDDDLKIENDPMVGFFRSEYLGRPVVYFRYSGIEHIFG